LTGTWRGTEGLRVERRWTISNLLSLSRVLLAVPIVVLILKQGYEFRTAVVVLMFVTAATDFSTAFWPGVSIRSPTSEGCSIPRRIKFA